MVTQNQGLPNPAYPLVDVSTGKSSPVWFQFFNSLWQRTGGGSNQGNVQSISVTSSNGIVSSVVNPTGMPDITLALDIPAVQAQLGLFTPISAGIVPASGGGAVNFLRADTRWTPVVQTTGSPVSGNLSQFSGATTITNGDLSGDISTTGTLVTTLATVNSNVGTFQGITVNAKGLVTAASDQHYITGNQTITLSGDASGSGTTAITVTLATVNSNVGTFQGITVNAKGLVTAASDQHYISGNQTITLSGDVSGSGTTAITSTLATVNSNVGSFTNASITVNAKGLVTAASSGTTALVSVKQQVFSSNGTYTPSSGMVACWIRIKGGGGGGGGAQGTTGQSSAASGGGEGGYAEGVFTASQINGTAQITVGTGGAGGTAGNNNGTGGGTSSVKANGGAGATLLSATGGGAGTGSASNATATNFTPGGIGGQGTTGTYGSGGCCGQMGIFSGTYGTAYSGAGGGMGGGNSVQGAGVAAYAHSGGGGSGAASPSGNTSFAGGAGADGEVLVIEWCTQ